MPFRKKQTAGFYLAALIDGEGTITRCGRKSRAVRITNTDLNIISAGTACLAKLGISYKIYKRKSTKGKQAFDIVVHGEDNFRRVLASVPIQSQEKRKRLNELIGSYVDRHQIPNLRRLYENNSVAEIAGKTGKPPSVVYYLLKKQNIQRRTLSASVKKWWGKGGRNAI